TVALYRRRRSSAISSGVMRPSAAQRTYCGPQAGAEKGSFALSIPDRTANGSRPGRRKTAGCRKPALSLASGVRPLTPDPRLYQDRITYRRDRDRREGDVVQRRDRKLAEAEGHRRADTGVVREPEEIIDRV